MTKKIILTSLMVTMALVALVTMTPAMSAFAADCDGEFRECIGDCSGVIRCIEICGHIHDECEATPV